MSHDNLCSISVALELEHSQNYHKTLLKYRLLGPTEKYLVTKAEWGLRVVLLLGFQVMSILMVRSLVTCDL